ncbi:MAG: hypothetical protein KJ072_05015 [Verrucomicrobia bacterium]|nr:hypothetical protein [Verrucomicrobiota bacterium]
MRYLVDSVAHLGRFFLSEQAAAGGNSTIWLEGPDGQVFRPSDVLPVLSREGRPVALTGADVVLGWLVKPGRAPQEVKFGLRYLSQWPEGPQASLAWSSAGQSKGVRGQPK